MLVEFRRQVDSGFPEYELRNISNFAVEARYPDESYQPDAEETRYYAQLARRIVSDMKLWVSRT
jgi:hypothetical protein